MNKFGVIFAISFLFVACAPLASSQQKRSQPTPGNHTPPARTGPMPTRLPPDAHMTIRTSSLTLIVDDPVASLAILEQAVEDAGGTVVSASSYAYPDSTGYASLSARVSPEAVAGLRQTAIGIALNVQSDSTYGQDVTAEYRLMQNRLFQLQRAEEDLWRLLTETKDRELAASLTLLRELVQREQESLQSQLVNYDDRATGASFDVTFNQTPVAPIFLDGGTPTPTAYAPPP